MKMLGHEHRAGEALVHRMTAHGVNGRKPHFPSKLQRLLQRTQAAVDRGRCVDRLHVFNNLGHHCTDALMTMS